MKDLSNYIKAANHSSNSWLLKNHPEVYDEVIEYCKNIKDISYKQKLWHYQNQVPTLVKCSNNECDNLVKFKGRWTLGYYKFCCQKCSVVHVEQKKSLLNYSRVSSITKEEKIIKLEQKENNKLLLKHKIEENKIKKEDKKKYYSTITFDDYLELIKKGNGIYIRESFVKLNMPHIYNMVASFISLDDAYYDEKLYMYINKIKDRPKCKCNNNLSFVNKKKGYNLYCSKNCAASYGNKKASETLLATKGVTHHSKLHHNIEKWINIRIERIKTYIIDHNLLLSYDKIEDIYTFKCDKCNKNHNVSGTIMEQRMSNNLDWRNCITKSFSVSNPEIQIREYIKSIYEGDIILNNKKIISKEIDIYLPEINLAIEHNGLYWHNEENRGMMYHHNKWKLAKDKNIRLLQIYGDEWELKQNIVKSRIANILNKNQIYVDINKCEIKNVNYSDAILFFNNNHLQSCINCFNNVGLYYNNELISLISFSTPSVEIKHKLSNSIELYRFCNKLNYSINGAYKLLFDYFIKKNENIKVVYGISYLDFETNMFECLNMKLIDTVEYNYWYIKGNTRINEKTKSRIYGSGYKIYSLNRS